MPSIIEVDHVTKEFTLGTARSLRRTVLDGVRRLGGKPVEERPPFKALDNVHFSIEPGEVVGIIGHNGAGKSTLLKLLANIAAPTRGRIAVHGRVAPLIEVGAGLVPDLTGRENVYLNATILGMKKAEINRKFDEIVAFAELEEFIDTPVKRYSSGMQVRLGFAVATSVDAEVLIVDEVLAVGDLAFQRKCFDRMDRLINEGGRTVLVVGHNVRQIERICTRALLLDHGRVIADGEPPAVCNEYLAIQSSTAGFGGGNGPANLEGQPDQSVARQRGNEISGVSIRLSIDGKDVSTIEVSDALAIMVEFHSTRALPACDIGIGIETDDQLRVALIINKKPMDIVAGKNYWTCSTARFPLAPGSYLFRVGIKDRFSRMLWYGERIARITIIPHSRYPMSRLAGQALLELEYEWATADDAISSAPAPHPSFARDD